MAKKAKSRVVFTPKTRTAKKAKEVKTKAVDVERQKKYEHAVLRLGQQNDRSKSTNYSEDDMGAIANAILNNTVNRGSRR